MSNPEAEHDFEAAKKVFFDHVVAYQAASHNMATMMHNADRALNSAIRTTPKDVVFAVSAKINPAMQHVINTKFMFWKLARMNCEQQSSTKTV